MSSRDSILGDLHAPGAPLPGASVEARWVNLRLRRIPVWTALTAGSVALAAAIAMRMATEVGKPYIGASEITGGAVFLVASLVVAVWMVWVAPRVFTRQGVAVDSIGVALIQNPGLWFAGRTVRIPWSAIHSVGESERAAGQAGDRRHRRIATLLVNSEDRGAVVPSWASAVPRGAPPRIRIDISPGDRRQPKVFEALRAVRPDLVV